MSLTNVGVTSVGPTRIGLVGARHGGGLQENKGCRGRRTGRFTLGFLLRDHYEQPFRIMTDSIIERDDICSAITAELERRDQGPREINGGHCEDFAGSVIQRLGGERERLYAAGCEVDGAWTMGRWGGHVWIVAESLGLHFDAEAPGGVHDWQSLPFYRRKKEDPSHPIGAVGTDALRGGTEEVTEAGALKQIESWWDVNVGYEHGPDGTDGHRAEIANETYVPTVWVKGDLPTRALKDCLHGRCPTRQDWREWLDEEEEIREKKGFETYEEWFEGGIRAPIIVDGQGPHIWDGWHRTAWVIVNGRGTVPAYLGIEAGPTPAANRLKAGSLQE